MELKLRGKVWCVHFKGPNGERLRPSTGETDYSLAQLKAVEIMREHLVDMVPEEDRRRAASLETLGGILRTCWHKVWQEQKGAKDLKTRVFKISREIGHWTLPMVDYDRVEIYLDGLTKGKNQIPLSNATKNRYVSAISKAFTEARKRDKSIVIPEFPSWPENNVKERYVSDAEETTIDAWFHQNTAPANVQRTYLWNLFRLLIDSGMRCSEALVEMTEPRLVASTSGGHRVHLQHGATKSGKGRMVPLTKRAEAAARAMIASPLHGSQDSNNLGRQWKNVMEKLGIEGVTLHTLRHTCASRLVQRKVPLYEVMFWMGHSSIEVTKRYAHLAEDSLDGALAVLERNAAADVPPTPDGFPAREAHPAASGTHSRPKLSVVR